MEEVIFMCVYMVLLSVYFFVQFYGGSSGSVYLISIQILVNIICIKYFIA